MHNLIDQPQVARQQQALSSYRQQWSESVHGMRGKTDRWTQPVTTADLRRDGLLKTIL
jgi:hypothetical protein